MTIARHLTLLSFLCTMTRAADSQQPRPTSLAHRSTVYAPHGMIATSQPLATAAGLAVLERGGNAVDAAVTAAAVLNVVEPPMTGIGGDLFAIVWSAKDHKLYGLNASGRSGSLMTSAALLAKGHTTMPQESVEDITVPGALSGWDALLRRFGSVTLAQALRPAIAYAEGGFPVTPIIAAEWATQVSKLRNDEGARTTYLVDDGRDVQGFPRVGTPAERPGRRRARDAQDPRAVRLEDAGSQQRRLPPPPDRGEEARLRRHRAVRGRPHGDDAACREPPHRRLRRVAPRAARPVPRGGPSRARQAAHRERDHLPHRGRLGRQHGVLHQFAVRPVRLRRRGAGHRVRAAGPGRRVHARAGPAEHCCTREATVPHDHTRLRYAAGRQGRRRAVAQRWRDGRLDAAAGSRAAVAQPDRVRDGSAGRDRRRALPAPRGAARRAGSADRRDGAPRARRAGPRADAGGRCRLRRSAGDHAAAAGLRRRLGSAQGRNGRRALRAAGAARWGPALASSWVSVHFLRAALALTSGWMKDWSMPPLR